MTSCDFDNTIIYEFEGYKNGILVEHILKPDEQLLSLENIELNKIVRINPSKIIASDCEVNLLDKKFVIMKFDENVNMNINTFGIFNHNKLNPISAYIKIGRDGYKNLNDKYLEYFEWDDDILTCPPDNL